MLIVQKCRNFDPKICRNTTPCHMKSTSEAFEDVGIKEFVVRYCHRAGKKIVESTETFKAKMEEALYYADKRNKM